MKKNKVVDASTPHKSFSKKCFNYFKAFLKHGSYSLVIALFLVLSSVMLVGCDKKLITLVKDNMSEITNIYFAGEGEMGKANISVGEREEPYILNGVHSKNVGFSLLELNLNRILTENTIEIELIVNGKSSKEKLEFFPRNNTYVQDVGYQFKASDSISIVYEQKSISFSNISKDFKVDSEKAIKICVEKLESKLKAYQTKNRLSGECYLKIMHMSGSNDVFWGFTFLGNDGKSINSIVNVMNEETIV